MPYPCPYGDSNPSNPHNLRTHLMGRPPKGHGKSREEADKIIAAIEPKAATPRSDSDTEQSEQVPPPPDVHRIRGLREGERVLPKSCWALLNDLADLVRKEHVLDLQIRDGYVNLYYGGGCLWKIEGLNSGAIRFLFDRKYFLRKNPTPSPDQMVLPDPDADPKEWLDRRTQMQEVMAGWFDENRKEERGVQQQLCSNHLRNPNSEWVILDVEYAAWLHGTKNKKSGSGRRLCRFDFVAFRRKEPGVLFLVELKISSAAMRGDSGAESHAADFDHFLRRNADGPARDAFRKSMRRVLAEKAELGLLPGADAEAILKDANWPSIIQPLFSLGHDAATCLGPRGGEGTLRKQVETRLAGLYTGPLWFNENLIPIAQ